MLRITMVSSICILLLGSLVLLQSYGDAMPMGGAGSMAGNETGSTNDVYCVIPPMVPGALDPSTEMFTEGDQMSYTCSTGYRWANSTSPNITCTASGNWTLLQNECIDQDECSEANTQKCDLCVNTVGSFNCTCNQGRRLSGSACFDVCESPDNLKAFSGSVKSESPSNNYFQHYVFTFSCVNGTVINGPTSIVCRKKNGSNELTWSGPVPTCTGSSSSTSPLSTPAIVGIAAGLALLALLAAVLVYCVTRSEKEMHREMDRKRSLVSLRLQEGVEEKRRKESQTSLLLPKESTNIGSVETQFLDSSIPEAAGDGSTDVVSSGSEKADHIPPPLKIPAAGSTESQALVTTAEGVGVSTPPPTQEEPSRFEEKDLSGSSAAAQPVSDAAAQSQDDAVPNVDGTMVVDATVVIENVSAAEAMPPTAPIETPASPGIMADKEVVAMLAAVSAMSAEEDVLAADGITQSAEVETPGNAVAEIQAAKEPQSGVSIDDPPESALSGKQGAEISAEADGLTSSTDATEIPGPATLDYNASQEVYFDDVAGQTTTDNPSDPGNEPSPALSVTNAEPPAQCGGVELTPEETPASVVEPPMAPQEEVIEKPQEEAAPEPQESTVTKTQEEAAAEPQENIEPEDEAATEPQEEAATEPQESIVTEPQESIAIEPQEEAATEPQESIVTEPQEEIVAEPKESSAVEHQGEAPAVDGDADVHAAEVEEAPVESAGDNPDKGDKITTEPESHDAGPPTHDGDVLASPTAAAGPSDATVSEMEGPSTHTTVAAEVDGEVESSPKTTSAEDVTAAPIETPIDSADTEPPKELQGESSDIAAQDEGETPVSEVI